LAKLRKERERQGLSRERLAERLHLSVEALASVEAGTVGKLTLGMLSRIAHSLGKQITYSLVEKVA
jgi:transcriptional regulator with XRE-family HTH domain